MRTRMVAVPVGKALDGGVDDEGGGGGSCGGDDNDDGCGGASDGDYGGDGDDGGGNDDDDDHVLFYEFKWPALFQRLLVFPISSSVYFITA